ncbi:MAG: aldehyde ferredoxin oxidoreductase family protein [Euryarchaeota archaeon]|nr:aldehyde ferredoxin oxidoreductase family protein [Euryarchaeota archaeon]
MPGGLHGKLLDVDLTTAAMSDWHIPADWASLHLGGRGIGARILLDQYEGRAEDDPLGPRNILVFMTGPLVGLSVPGAGKHAVYARSPLTGLFAEAFCGGYFGSELKKTGYDGIIIRGRAPEWQYLSVIDGRPEILPAGDLRGAPVSKTEAELLKRSPRARCASIGPAGENLVRFAAIMTDRNRAAGRCGVGAVMGSKTLKAIVVRGNAKVPVDDEAAYREALKDYISTLQSPGMKRFGEYGTPGGVESLDSLGILPTHNFHQGRFEGASKISGVRLHDDLLVGRDTCFACHVRCKRIVEGEVDGERIEKAQGGPEYETIAAFGSLQMVDSLEHVSLANARCNEHGLDTISAGNVIAFAMEASERGLIDDGVAWGDASKALRLLDDIAYRRGLGETLSLGVREAARRLGGSDFAIHVKGLEVPMHEPRGKKGLGLTYAVGPRGANHNEGLHDTSVERANASPELGATAALSRFDASERKTAVVKNWEDAVSFTNSLIVCLFTTNLTGKAYNLPHLRRLVTAVTGVQMDRDSMLEVGERNFNLGRLFTTRMGARPEDDDLPPRFKREPLDFGDRQEAIPDDVLRPWIADYYALRGWGVDGAPSPATLARLGLSTLARA